MQGDLQRVLIGVAAALLLLWGIVLGIEKFRTHQVTQAQAGAAVAGQAQAGHEAVAKEHEAQLVSLQEQLTKSRAEVARAKAALAAAKSPVIPDGSPSVSPSEPITDPHDAVIKAQDGMIANLESALKEATLRGDGYKLALEDATKRANLQEAALKAQMAAIVAAKWRGRIEGFAAGLGTGYIGGRLR